MNMETPTLSNEPSLYFDYLAGALGGVTGLIVGHPFDTTKVQLQTQNAEKGHQGTRAALKNIYSQHGWVKGFLRGLAWPVMSYGVINSIFFGVYGNSTTLIEKYTYKKSDGPSFLNIYLSGCIAGAVQISVACPIDLIKVILQSQIGANTHQDKGKRYFATPTQCAQAIYRERGISGFYRGLLAMSYRDIPSYGLYCLTYEYLENTLRGKNWTDNNGIMSSLIAGGTAGSLTWFCVMPLDMIKSRLQADMDNVYKGVIDCAKKTMREGGIRALYKGTLITCLRGFPVNAAIFLVYSQTLKYLKS